MFVTETENIEMKYYLTRWNVVISENGRIYIGRVDRQRSRTSAPDSRTSSALEMGPSSRRLPLFGHMKLKSC